PAEHGRQEQARQEVESEERGARVPLHHCVEPLRRGHQHPSLCQSFSRRSSWSRPVLSRVFWSTALITRAGCPAATTPGGMESTTTAPAATTLPFPTRHPSRTTAFAPTRT